MEDLEPYIIPLKLLIYLGEKTFEGQWMVQDVSMGC